MGGMSLELSLIELVNWMRKRFSCMHWKEVASVGRMSCASCFNKTLSFMS